MFYIDNTFIILYKMYYCSESMCKIVIILIARIVYRSNVFEPRVCRPRDMPTFMASQKQVGRCFSLFSPIFTGREQTTTSGSTDPGSGYQYSCV